MKNIKFKSIINKTILFFCLLLFLSACNKPDKNENKDSSTSPNEKKQNKLVYNQELDEDRDPNRTSEDIFLNDVSPSNDKLNFLPENIDIRADDYFSETELEEIKETIASDVANGFPGAVLLIAHKNQVILHTAHGYAKIYDKLEKLDNPQIMKKDTMFDLASLTKVFSTNLAIMKLESQGLIDINSYVSAYLPTYKSSPIRVKNLLIHNSGLMASYPFYNDDNFSSFDKEKTYSLIPKLNASYHIGDYAKYSDLGYIVLGQIVEKITGQDLDTYVENTFYKPLGLTKTCYRPLEKGFNIQDIAATERLGNTRDGNFPFEASRNYTLQGEVHDELAYYSMNGVSGNSGLFSTASDIAVLCQLLKNYGSYGKKNILDPNISYYHSLPSLDIPRYCLGYDNPANEKNHPYYGDKISGHAIGKTGWTGSLFVVDYDRDLIIVLLTNKRHSPFINGNFKANSYATGKYYPIINQIYDAYNN